MGKRDEFLTQELANAIMDNNNPRVKMLLSQGADHNRQYTKNGKTFLIQAIEQKNLAVVRSLIEAGANTCQKGGFPKSTPLSYAVRKAHIPMIKLLLANGASFAMHDGLEVAIESRNWTIINLLLENGGDLNTTFSNGDTALTKYVRLMNLPIVKYLLEQNVDLNKKNSNNETPLSVSLSNEDFRTFQLLIEAGADPALASEEIEEKIKTNPSFAAYMAKVQKKNSQSIDSVVPKLAKMKIKANSKPNHYFVGGLFMTLENSSNKSSFAELSDQEAATDYRDLYF